MYYVFLIVLMLVSVGIVGFLFASVGFVFLFLKKKAGVSYLWSITTALLVMALLVILSYYLVLIYPPGILQLFVELPWPLS